MSEQTLDKISADYFTPRFGWWRWAEKNCRELEGLWPDSSLIVFRVELTQILADLQPQGWPHLTSVLFVLAATRANWPQIGELLRQNLIKSLPGKRGYIAELIWELNRVHRVTNSLRESTPAKRELLRMIFEDARPQLPPEEAAVALNYLRAIIPYRDPAIWGAYAVHRGEAEFFDETLALKSGLARVSPEALASRLQTGVEQELAPAPVSLPDDPASYSARLVQWATDAELCGIARIARQLVPILAWPRSVSEPDDLALGGVSDLTNSGPLDRLLLSELAHDDDTLAVRIALKEALYIRRESPTHPTPQQRAVFVDTSLRLWGRPRIYAAAVALALAVAQDQDAELSVTVDVADSLGRYRPLDLTTRAGAMELLAALSPRLHFADVLPAWNEQRLTEDGARDAVLITTPDVLADLEVQTALGQLPATFYAALIAADGRFELRQHSLHGWRTLRQATLDLDELLKPPVNARPLSLSRGSPDRLPAIYRADPFPLRLTHPLEPGQLWMLPGGAVVSLGSGNRLMLWDGTGKAARQLSTKAPTGKIEAALASPYAQFALQNAIDHYTYPHRAILALVLRGKGWTFLWAELATNELHIHELQTAQSPANQSVKALIADECVFLISPQLIEAFSPQNGELLAKQAMARSAQLEFVGNRCLRRAGGQWFRLSFDGAIRLTPIKGHGSPNSLLVDPVAYQTSNPPLEYHQPRVPHEPQQPWCVFCERGKAVGSHTVPTFREQQIQQVQQRGSLVILQGTFAELAGTSWIRPCTVVLDLLEEQWQWRLFHDTQIDVAVRNLAFSRLKPRQNLRHKFTLLDCSRGRVVLKSARQWWLLEPTQDRLRLVAIELKDSPGQSVPFERHSWPGMTLSLRTALLPNGNAVWLDGRGLMHLLPADTTLPEVTLVLDEDNLSGWMSDGVVFGAPYYHEDGLPTRDVRQVWQQHICPFFGVSA